MAYLLRFMKLAGLLFLFGLVILFFQFNIFALQLADSWSQGTGWVVFLVLTLAELAGFLLLGYAWFPSRSRLVLKANPTAEEQQAFCAEMHRRLAENSIIQAHNLKPCDPDFIARALEILDARADETIRSDARKIFLGTALAQNGRLDALIVFIALARMVWRISTIYNQRPTPAEIWSVYTAVSSSAFVAFTLDALDIPRTVTEALSSLVPAVAPSMAGSSMPIVGMSMHLFTQAMLDGAANGFLAIRAGVLTKNAFRYSGLDRDAARSLSSREIRSTMLSLSRECLGDITSGLKEQVKDMAGSVADNCVEKTRNAARSVASSVTDAASSAGGLVLRGGEAVVDAVSTGVGSTVDAVTSTASQAASTVTRTTETVTGAVKDTVSSAAHTVTRTTEAVTGAVRDTVSSAAHTVSKTTDAVTGAVRDTVSTAAHTVSKTTDAVTGAVKSTVTGTVDLASDTLRSAGHAVSQGGAAVRRTVQEGRDTAKKLLHGAGSLFGSVLPHRKRTGRYTADEEAALRLALLWCEGRLSAERLAALAGFAHQQKVSQGLMVLFSAEPDLDALSPWLAKWRGQEEDVLRLMDELHLVPESPAACTWLGELGAFLGLGTVLADRRL
ncbi:MAG TPA: collagen-like triple helix repeat-containing protein [Candidatus Desulfovibrio intestinipullorum]|uniref:Collagen-like triple helix repeat-containing protein n=1 Tax=Candidatus Desulfovibrio intestinipullorum TaxID=2838536 RepID=A0A9D1PW40_9BACT|nr:collagen-like triple helix repeat-containing protein [Candidatus Desulfovibrio intestinipullorum]